MLLGDGIKYKILSGSLVLLRIEILLWNLIERNTHHLSNTKLVMLQSR